jgi:hypothetical protein
MRIQIQLIRVVGWLLEIQHRDDPWRSGGIKELYDYDQNQLSCGYDPSLIIVIGPTQKHRESRITTSNIKRC